MKIATPAGLRTSCMMGLLAAASFGLSGCGCDCIGEVFGFGGDDAETTEATSNEESGTQSGSEAKQETKLDGETLGYEGIDFEVDGDAEFDLATLRAPVVITNASR